MGHDAVKICGRYAIFSDTGLWVLRHFFVEESKAVAAAEPTAVAGAVVAYFESWDWVTNGLFVGPSLECIDPASAGFVSSVLQVFARTRQKIAAQGELIVDQSPPIGVGWPHPNDTPILLVEPLLDDIDRLAELFRLAQLSPSPWRADHSDADRS